MRTVPPEPARAALLDQLKSYSLGELAAYCSGVIAGANSHHPDVHRALLGRLSHLGMLTIPARPAARRPRKPRLRKTPPAPVVIVRLCGCGQTFSTRDGRRRRCDTCRPPGRRAA